MASRSPDAATRSVPIAAASVKICGVQTVEHALAAADAGAQLIGMIFAPAHRRVSFETARAISDTVHATRPGVRLVGVFVDASPADVNAAAEAAGLDLVQLHGGETPAEIGSIDRGVIKVFRPVPAEDVDHLTERIEAYLTAAVPPIAVLIDGFDPHADGGTGARADWALVGTVSERLTRHVGLAGGLAPDNVEAAIGQVRPGFVDVSSGVERDGVKDEALIRSFVEQADRAFRTSIR